MAILTRVHGISLLLLVFLFFCFWQQVAQGHRKIQSSKLPNRVLMSVQSSSPSFYNAFDPVFQTHASMYTNTLHHDDTSLPSSHDNHIVNKDSVGFNDNPSKQSVDFNDNTNKVESNFNDKSSYNKGFGASLDSTHDASYPTTYTKYYNYDNNDNFAASTSDYKPNGDKFSYPTFSAPSTSSQSLYGRKFPASFEAPFLNKESYGQDTRGQQGLYNGSPSSGQQSLYRSPSSEKSLYTSPSNDQTLYSSSPSNFYKASYPFDSYNHSPSTTPKVSEFDEFAQSHPVSNYDNFFNTPTVNGNVVNTSPLGRPTFPVSDHDLTYGQVQVP